MFFIFFFKQKTAYEMRISDWSSDVCPSDLFRSMTEAHRIDRGPYDGIESERITRLGSLLRRLRVDELPQFWNILRGDMSLIGPRPDYYPHAVVYCHDIPNYSNRHLVRPGIPGLAHVRIGHAPCPRHTGKP